MKNQKLIDILTEQTQSLKLQYIEKTKEWAKRDFEYSCKVLARTTEDWCKYFKIEPEIKNKNTPSMQFLGFPTNFYNTKNSSIMRREQEKAIRIKRLGLDEYVIQKEKEGVDHYESSIEKLAYRIEQKGLNLNNLTVGTTHIKQNIETILTDGIQRVRAFTILAWGEIQRPHYRYLIK